MEGSEADKHSRVNPGRVSGGRSTDSEVRSAYTVVSTTAQFGKGLNLQYRSECCSPRQSLMFLY